MSGIIMTTVVHCILNSSWLFLQVLDASRQRADSEDTLRRKELQYMTAQNAADQILADLKTAVQKAW